MILSVLIPSISTFIALVVAQKLFKNAIESQKNELFDWLKTEDGMMTVASLGRLFGAGAMQAVGTGKRGGSMKIFGFKIPNSVIDNIVTPIILGEAKKRGLLPTE